MYTFFGTLCRLSATFLGGEPEETRWEDPEKDGWMINHGLIEEWAGQRSRYSDWLRAGRSGDRIPAGARFSAPVKTGPGAHPASCTMGKGSFPG